MATRSFELRTTVSVDPDAAIDFLMNLDGHRGMHPFLVSAEVVTTGSDDDGPWWDWRVLERPQLGPFRYPIRFPARMQRRSPTSMLGSVRAAPGCTLTTRTTAEVSDGSTVLHETTTVSAPRLLLGYMASQAQVAHARTFSLLPSELAGRRAG